MKESDRQIYALVVYVSIYWKTQSVHCINLKEKLLVIILSQIATMLHFGDGSAFGGYESVHTRADLLRHLLRSFPISRELTVFAGACDSFGLVKNQISDPNGMEFYRMIMDPYNAKFVECLP